MRSKIKMSRVMQIIAEEVASATEQGDTKEPQGIKALHAQLSNAAATVKPLGDLEEKLNAFLEKQNEFSKPIVDAIVPLVQKLLDTLESVSQSVLSGEQTYLDRKSLTPPRASEPVQSPDGLRGTREIPVKMKIN